MHSMENGNERSLCLDIDIDIDYLLLLPPRANSLNICSKIDNLVDSFANIGFMAQQLLKYPNYPLPRYIFC